MDEEEEEEEETKEKVKGSGKNWSNHDRIFLCIGVSGY